MSQPGSLDSAPVTAGLAAGSDETSAKDAMAYAMQVQQKYQEERQKRLRAEGNAQFIDTGLSDSFKHFAKDPWVTTAKSVAEASSVVPNSRCKVLVLGAGIGGLLQAARLTEAGVVAEDICIVDIAGSWGGTWYWNRYPGLMCDLESYCYLPLLEEMGYMPRHKYSYGTEIRAYLETIADKYGLQRRAMFQSETKALKWDDESKDWVADILQSRTGHEPQQLQLRAQFVIIASGVLHHPKLPDLPGVADFKGHSFHTSRWDYAYTGGSPEDSALENLKDKTVGIIGTGATAVQAVPHLAKWAKHLYVFQRTPSSVDARGQRPTDPKWFASEVQGEKGWQKKRNENLALQFSDKAPKPEDPVNDGWSKRYTYSGLIGGPTPVSMENVQEFVGTLHALDLPRTEMVRARTDKIVKNKDTADKLKAWYPTWCKRPCFHDDYLETFNAPNLTLVDTAGKGIDGMTPTGPSYAGTTYDVDLLIWATGFRTPFGGSPTTKAGIAATGRNGASFDAKFFTNMATLHGVVSRDFPNLFYPGPLQAGATANNSFVLDQLGQHIAYIISETTKRANGKPCAVEPSVEAEEAWSMEIVKRAVSFAGMMGCTPGYLNREGEVDWPRSAEEQMKGARSAIWGDGMVDYLRVVEAWREEGRMKGLVVGV